MLMKTYIFILAIFLGVQLQAQSIERQVIGAAGTTLVGNELLLDYTLGEIAINTIHTEDVILTQGFHQLPYAVITIDPDPPTVFSLYPNPTSGLVIIEGEGIQQTELYSISGQKVFQTQENRFDISHLSSGVYLVKITTITEVITKRVVKD